MTAISNALETDDRMTFSSNPLDAESSTFLRNLERRKHNRDVFLYWIRSALVEGRDYGSISIHGKPSKPSLYKPGAEKITGMLGLIPKFPNIEQYEQAARDGCTLTTIILKCELHGPSGEIVGEGVGARDIERQDQGDLNKALKMASKSAMIDATLRCAGISEVFTQDIEESHTSQYNSVNCEISTAPIWNATDRQLGALRKLAEHPKLSSKELEMLDEAMLKGVSKAKASEILEYFYGRSEKIDGSWFKVSAGQLDLR